MELTADGPTAAQPLRRDPLSAPQEVPQPVVAATASSTMAKRPADGSPSRSPCPTPVETAAHVPLHGGGPDLGPSMGEMQAASGREEPPPAREKMAAARTEGISLRPGTIIIHKGVRRYRPGDGG